MNTRKRLVQSNCLVWHCFRFSASSDQYRVESSVGIIMTLRSLFSSSFRPSNHSLYLLHGVQVFHSNNTFTLSTTSPSFRTLKFKGLRACHRWQMKAAFVLLCLNAQRVHLHVFWWLDEFIEWYFLCWFRHSPLKYFNQFPNFLN